jgi:GTPase Era involved in 16S rRNA processing
MCLVFFKGKGDMKKIRIMSFGVNQMGDINYNTPGVHAEEDALSKLMPLKYKKKLEPINMLVIRVSSKNKIQSSKPCSNCIKQLGTIPKKKGYKIDNIYYSNDEGKIVKTNLQTLENEEQHYSKYYRNKLNIS